MIRVPSILDLLAQGLSDGFARFVIRVCDQRYARRRPATPGLVRFASRQSEVHMAQFEVTAALPAPAKPDDVSARKLTMAIDSGDMTIYDLDPTATSFTFPTPFGFGQVLTGALTDIDAAGNVSEPSTYSYSVVDETPPPQPGQITFASRQID